MVEQSVEQRRSRLMARVRRRGTAPELALRKALWHAGYRYRLQTKLRLPGTPDFVFPGKKIAMFVDGCFWHGCSLHGTFPKTNQQFWLAKLQRNRERDSEVDRQLAELGWKVVRVWEHETQKKEIALTVQRVSAILAAG